MTNRSISWQSVNRKVELAITLFNRYNPEGTNPNPRMLKMIADRHLRPLAAQYEELAAETKMNELYIMAGILRGIINTINSYLSRD